MASGPVGIDHQDVAWLDVAMDQAHAVEVLSPLDQVHDQADVKAGTFVSKGRNHL